MVEKSTKKTTKKTTPKHPPKKAKRLKVPEAPDEFEEQIIVAVQMPLALVNEIDAFAAYASKERFQKIKRAEAIRDLCSYALRAWRRKYLEPAERGEITEPSLF